MKKVRYVVLVHGIFDDGRVFSRMSSKLISHDYVPLTIDLKPNYGCVGLDVLAAQLEKFINEFVPPDERLALVGFSMGGIVSRHYLQYLSGLERVTKFIAISSPHKGTMTGFLLPLKGCLQMRIGSRYLAKLNQTVKSLECLSPVSIWTKYDLMIFPPKRSIIGIGQVLHLPVFPHRSMASSDRAASAVIRCLDEMNEELKRKEIEPV